MRYVTFECSLKSFWMMCTQHKAPKSKYELKLYLLLHFIYTSQIFLQRFKLSPEVVFFFFLFVPCLCVSSEISTLCQAAWPFRASERHKTLLLGFWHDSTQPVSSRLDKELLTEETESSSVQYKQGPSSESKSTRDCRQPLCSDVVSEERPAPVSVTLLIRPPKEPFLRSAERARVKE